MSYNNFHQLKKLNNSSPVEIEATLKSSETSSNFRFAENSTQSELNTLDRAESKVWEGIKLEQENQLDEAIECYRQAAELNSQSAVAHHILAIALKKQNNLTEADYYHRIAISLGQNSSLKSNRQESNSSDLTLSTSSVVLPRLTAVAPGTYVEDNQLEVTKIYLQQAKLYYADARWQESINSCQEALKVCADLPEIYKIYGNSLLQMGKVPEAMGYYAQALAKDPHIAEVYANIGSLYAKQSNWQETINYYQKALTLDPQQAKIHLHLSKVWEKVGEDERALDALFSALDLQPEILNVDQYIQLAEDLLAENQVQLAITCCEHGLKMESPSKTLYLKLVEILEKDGQLAKAAGYRQIIVNWSEKSPRSKTKKLKIHRLLANTSAKQSGKQKVLEASKAIVRQPARQIQGKGEPFKQETESEIAIARYLEELKKQPNSSTIRLKIANLYASQQQWQEAASYYQQAIKIEPENAIAFLKLGKVCGALGKHREGAELIYRAYSIEPEMATAEEHFKLGEFWLHQNKGKVAMSCYRRAIQLKPDFAVAYERLKQLIALQTQQTQSAKSTEENGEKKTALDSQPKQATPEQQYYQQAIAAVKAQDWQLAMRCYQQAIEVNPQQPVYHYNLGKIQVQLKQWQAALQNYHQAAELAPDNADIQHNLGEVFSHQASWENAVPAYQKAITLGSKNSWTYHNLGYALLQLKQWQSAAEYFSQAISLKSDFVWSHYNLGEALAHLEQWDRALTAYQSAQELDPDLSEAKVKISGILYQRSQQSHQKALSFCKEQLLQEPDNIELYHQAISLDRKNAELYLGLAKALVKQSKIDEAISIYQVGLQLQPENSDLLQGLNKLKSPQKEAPSSFNVIAKIGNNVNPAPLDSGAKIQYDALQFPSHPSPVVSIVIPVHNHSDYTYKCLRSIVEHLPAMATEVIVVNDCSTDDTVGMLNRVTGLKRIDNSENLGFLHSCNLGIKAASGEYIYFLNNDTELRSQAVEHLLTVLEQDSEVGAVGSKLIYPDGSLQEAGGIVFQNASAWNYGTKQNVHEPQYNYLRPVDYCSGASLLVKKSVLTALDGFDTNFAPAYYEDTDLCFAIRHQLGLKVIYQPKSEVIHHEGISCGTKSDDSIKRYQSINQLKFTQKWAKELADYPDDASQSGIATASRRHCGSKTILVIDLDAPNYEPELGGRRIGELLKILQQLDYHVVFLTDNAEQEQPLEVLQARSIEVIYSDSKHDLTIEQQLNELLPLVDIAWVCRPQLYEKYAPLVRQHRGIKLIYDTVELYYLRLQRRVKPEDNDFKSVHQWVQMQIRELKAAYEADLTITISPVEQKILQSQGVSNLAVVPNIHPMYRGERASYAARKGLLFLGCNCSHNLNQVRWLVQEIMPLVWQKMPELAITLLDYNPSAELIELGQDDRIILTKIAADITPHFISHRVLVNLLNNDERIKETIGESLKFGLPIVSTTAGISGINLTNEENVLEANRSNEFAQQILRLYSEEKLWCRLAESGAEIIANFSPESVFHRIKKITNRL